MVSPVFRRSEKAWDRRTGRDSGRRTWRRVFLQGHQTFAVLLTANIISGFIENQEGEAKETRGQGASNYPEPRTFLISRVARGFSGDIVDRGGG